MARETSTDLFVRYIQQTRPLKSMPIAVRYGLTLVLVLCAFAVRYGLDGVYPYPYLVFLPAVFLAAFIFDRGTGFFATVLSAALAFYFFVAPTSQFSAEGAGQMMSVVIFTGVGFLSASIIEALRTAVEELADKEQALRKNLNLLETVIEGTPDPIFVKDLDGRYMRANTVLASIFGVQTSTLVGRRDRDFLPEDQATQIESADRMVMNTRAPFVLEEQMTVAGRGPRWFLSTKAPWYGADGSLSGIIGIARDIDERKQAEGALRQANEQKDLLLYDINHRVKNHLQSVMATLSISRRRTPDPEAREAIDSTINRLSVLARVYDRLQLRPGGEAVVSAKEFIEGLVGDLAPSLIDQRSIRVDVEIANEAVEIGRAVSLGLVINEALANTLKHGFPDNRSGRISIALLRSGDAFHLDIRDNGIGFEPDSVQGGIGMKLMRSLAQQLGGTVVVEGQSGTAIHLRFPAA